ncbi:MAG: hypothetical protein ABUK01_14750 [Leptospirales bacterium]
MAENNEHFTYLLGAGASCNALPLVSNMGEKLRFFIAWFKDLYAVQQPLSGKPGISRQLNDIEKEFITSLKWLEKECGNNTSIDTYAKKLYHQGDFDRYNRLKATLSCYFMIEQARLRVDQRYDNFFASILENESGSAKLPPDINIISWNYDSQLERSYSSFLKDAAENILGEQISVSMQLIPRKDEKMEIDRDKFSIVKINGSAEAHSINNSDFHDYDKFPYFKEVNQEVIDKVMEWYNQYINRKDKPISTLIHFAWETDDPYPRKMKDQLLKVTGKTTTLIVIGYSFPFFNRGIDKLYLENMKNLRRVYIQVPEADGPAHRERFEALISERKTIITSGGFIANPPPEIYLKHDTDQFFLPYEF